MFDSVVDLTNVTNDAEDLTEYVSKLQELEKEASHLASEIKENMKLNGGYRDRNENDINRFYEELVCKLDVLKKETKKEVSDRHSNTADHLKKNLQSCKENQRLIHQQCDAIELLVQKRHDRNVYIVLKRAAKKINEFTYENIQCKKKNTFEKLAFVRNLELENILKKETNEFGTFMNVCDGVKKDNDHIQSTIEFYPTVAQAFEEIMSTEGSAVVRTVDVSSNANQPLMQPQKQGPTSVISTQSSESNPKLIHCSVGVLTSSCTTTSSLDSCSTEGQDKPGSTALSSMIAASKTVTTASECRFGQRSSLTGEPNIDFKPVIQLPDLVEVKTGEEEEEKLFSERAKLFRFDEESGQWKERGIGDIKILRHNCTNSVRIIMRREQVLKLCANHKINPEMKMSPMASSNRALVWNAMDFSEGEAKAQKFAVKFKTPDIAEMFRLVFETNTLAQAVAKADTATKADLDAGCKNDNAKMELNGDLDSLLKIKVDNWKCQGCYVVNAAGVLTCPCCEALKPEANAEGVNVTCSRASFCSSACGGVTMNTSVTASNAQTVGAFTFGSASLNGFPSSSSTSFSYDSVKTTNIPSGGFVFGGVSNVSVGTAAFRTAEQNPMSRLSLFKFGASDQMFSFTFKSEFGAARRSSYEFDSNAKRGKKLGTEGFKFTLTDTEKHNPPAGLNSGYNFFPNIVKIESHNSQTYLEPIIKLPDKVELKTGEEEEDVLFCHRAKLFWFVNGEWKERGLGDVKVLLHPMNNKARIVMRREQILKLCCNHYITPELSLRTMTNSSGAALIWYAMDFAEGDSKAKQFAIKFKNKEVAQQFQTAVDEAKSKISKDISKISAKALALSLGQHRVASVNGDEHDGDEEDDYHSNDYEAEDKDSDTGDGQESGTLGKKAPIGRVEITFKMCSEPAPIQPSSRQTDKSYIKPSRLVVPKGVGCGMSTVGSGSPSTLTHAQQVKADKTEQEVNDYETAVDDTEDANNHDWCDVTDDDKSEQSRIPDMGDYVFGEGLAGFSFAALAHSSISKTFTTESSKPFHWKGAGTQLFGSSAAGGEDDDGDDVAQGEDLHFEPIAPLPDLVDVETGEEDETVVYRQRSKLFRFDVHQWKEKGIGDMKILKHKVTGKYRLIMRREQVYKLACNHLLTTDLFFTKLKTSETSWCWTALDYSENEPIMEQFALKFTVM